MHLFNLTSLFLDDEHPRNDRHSNLIRASIFVNEEYLASLVWKPELGSVEKSTSDLVFLNVVAIRPLAAAVSRSRIRRPMVHDAGSSRTHNV